MFGFDKMFDFNRDGKLDSWERVAQFQFMDEMMKDDEKSIFDDDDEIDTFADAGLDYDELEFMDPDERREVLEDAVLVVMSKEKLIKEELVDPENFEDESN